MVWKGDIPYFKTNKEGVYVDSINNKKLSLNYEPLHTYELPLARTTYCMLYVVPGTLFAFSSRFAFFVVGKGKSSRATMYVHTYYIPYYYLVGMYYRYVHSEDV